MSAPPLAAAKLDALGLDWVCSQLADGMTMTALAEVAEVSKGSLLTWCAHPDRSARVIESRALAASVWDEKAEAGLENSEEPFSLAKAKELAHHYRWRASKIAPRLYGDKLTQEHTGKDGGPIILATGVPRDASDD